MMFNKTILITKSDEKLLAIAYWCPVFLFERVKLVSRINLIDSEMNNQTQKNVFTANWETLIDGTDNQSLLSGFKPRYYSCKLGFFE